MLSKFNKSQYEEALVVTMTYPTLLLSGHFYLANSLNVMCFTVCICLGFRFENK
jgi:hypothetical protein